MYILKPGIKQDSYRQWALPDRIFFGHGACHILAGVFLDSFADSAWKAAWVKPIDGFGGSHIYVTDGEIAFDYHGYSVLDRLQTHHQKVSRSRFNGWKANIAAVDFCLLNTTELNRRSMRGPGQFHGDVVARARRYVERIDHDRLQTKARSLVENSEFSSTISPQTPC